MYMLDFDVMDARSDNTIDKHDYIHKMKDFGADYIMNQVKKDYPGYRGDILRFRIAERICQTHSAPQVLH